MTLKTGMYFQVSLILIFSCISPLKAATLRGPDQYPTIQAASISPNGKAILVISGDNVVIGRGARFTMTGSCFHDAYIGHNVKSRADENYILYNRMFDLNDHSSDRPFQTLYVVNNTLVNDRKNGIAIRRGGPARVPIFW